MPSRPPPDECAQCGAVLPRTARACPECGADERTGWREVDLYDGLDLPEPSNDDRPGRSSIRPTRRINGVAWYWWLVGAVLLLLLLSRLPGWR